jgi:hypothetical protein
MMSCASNNEEATTATIGCVHDRTDDYNSDEKNPREGDNRDSARGWKKTAWEGDNRGSAGSWKRASCDYKVKCDEEQTPSGKERTQRAANVKLEEAKKSDLRYKRMSDLHIEKEKHTKRFSGIQVRRLRQKPSVVSMTDLMLIIQMKRLTGQLTIGKPRESGVKIGNIGKSAIR